LLAVLMLGATGRVVGQTAIQADARTEAPASFDIPAQPLVRALDAYSTATGLMVLYDSDLAEGRRSTAVNGVLLPDVAIRVLLEGTGLVAFSAGKAFAVEPEAQPRGADVSGAVRQPYLALVQQAIERAFCDGTETRPGEYRAALQFRIGISGEVSSPELLSSTGDRQRDRAIVELLGRVRIPRGPPPEMAQPVSMIISPRPPAQSGDCGFPGKSPLSQARP
jgi:hypothetical protein